MKWTTETPTEPGFYWLKYIDKEKGVTRELVQLRQDKVYLKVCHKYGALYLEPVGLKRMYPRNKIMEFVKDVKPIGWAGPIPEPEE